MAMRRAVTVAAGAARRSRVTFMAPSTNFLATALPLEEQTILPIPHRAVGDNAKDFAYSRAFHTSPFAQQAAPEGYGEGGRLVPVREGESVWALGMRVTVKTKGEHTGGAYSIMEYHLQPGDGSDEHQHGNEDEAWFVLDGKMQWKFEDQVFEANKGDFIHMPRGHRHSFHNVSDKEAHMLVHCIPAGLENYFLEVGKPVDPDPTAKKPAMTPEIAKKASEMAEKYGLTYFQAVESLKAGQEGGSSGSTGGQSDHSSGSGADPKKVMEEVRETEKGYQ